MTELSDHLRILAANEDKATLADIDEILRELGHEVAAHAVGVREAARLIAREQPDVAVVVLHDDTEHALALIDELAESAAVGPVIALLDSDDPDFVAAAAELGIYAYARPTEPAAVQGAIEVAVRRHAETARLAEQVDQLEGALERRAVIERAKGILMERHGVDDRAAFGLLRDHARAHSRTVVVVAHNVVDGHALLPGAAESHG